MNSALEEREDYDKMKKSIVISFVDKVLFPDIHTRFLVKEEQTGHPLTDRLILHFIELGKVSADRAVEDLDPLERFAAYMKYCSDPQKEDYVNQLLDSGEEAVQMSEHVYKKVTESDLAREMLEREEKAAHDIATMKVHARREGLAEGLAEGRKEGKAEGLAEGRAEDIVAGVQQVKRALRLSAEGKTPEEIAAELDLTIEIVREMLDLEAVIE